MFLQKSFYICFTLPFLPFANVHIDYMIPYFIVIPIEGKELSQNGFEIGNHGTDSCRLINRWKFVIYLQEKNYKNRNDIRVEFELCDSQSIQSDLPHSNKCN